MPDDDDAKTEGQRLLRAEPGSLASIAKAVGCGRTIASAWRNGEKLPSDALRRRLRDVYGIPERAWDVVPGGLDAPPPRAEEDDEVEDLDTLALAVADLREVRRELRRGDLTQAQRAKLRDSSQKLLALKYRLERDRELVEDRVVRGHPAWARIKDVMAAALEPYPDAAVAVAEALEEVESE